MQYIFQIAEKKCNWAENPVSFMDWLVYKGLKQRSEPSQLRIYHIFRISYVRVSDGDPWELALSLMYNACEQFLKKKRK